MNILLITPYFYPERFKINDLALSLAKKNKVYVFTQRNFFEKKNKRFKNIEIFYFPTFNHKNSGISKTLLNYITLIISSFFFTYRLINLKIDKLLVFQISPIFILIPGIILKKIKKIELNCWLLDYWPDAALTKNIILKKILSQVSKILYSYVNTFFISSKGFEKKLKKIFKKKKIFYFPQWAEDTFKFVKLTKIKKLNIFVTGNIGIAQDPITILKLVNSLKKENITFYFYGDGRCKYWLMKKIKDAKLKNCKFYNSISTIKLSEKLKICDLTLISLINQKVINLTMPARIFSSLKSGIPICNISSGVVGDLILNNKCGISSKSGNYIDASMKIRKFKNLSIHKKLLIKKNCYNIYNKHFDKNLRITEIENIY